MSGDLAAERRLPSVRKLAALYGVSVPTMHAAVHALAALGLIRISHGVGMFVERPRFNAALLNHAWQQATSMELALMRAAIDERMPIVVAQRVRTSPDVRLPRTLSDISFLVQDRSLRRNGYPEAFLRADFAFHRTIAASVRGTEIMVSLHERVGQRLMPALMPVADLQACDAELDRAHLELAAAILDGQPLPTARLARMVARRELHSLEQTLG